MRAKIIAHIEPIGNARHRTRIITPRRGKPFVQTYPDKATEAWKASFAVLAGAQLRAQGVVQFQPPCRVDVDAYFSRPAYMLERYKRDNVKRGIVAGQAKCPEGRIWYPAKPDRDNVDKAVLDSLNEWWPDDCCVVCGEVRKFYAEIDGRPRVEVTIDDYIGDAE